VPPFFFLIIIHFETHTSKADVRVVNDTNNMLSGTNSINIMPTVVFPILAAGA
jgi:hypothetical protein